MKKRIVALMLIIAFVFSMSAYAAEPRIVSITPTLKFSGTTANCSAVVMALDKHLEVTMTLYRALSVIEQWTAEGDGYVSLSGSAAVKKGLEYRLVVSGTINGVPFTGQELVRTCE